MDRHPDDLMEFRSTTASSAAASPTVASSLSISGAFVSSPTKTTTIARSITTTAAVPRSTSSTSLLPPSESNSEDYLASFAGDDELTNSIVGAAEDLVVKNSAIPTASNENIIEAIESSDVFDSDIHSNTKSNSSENNSDTITGDDNISGSGNMANNPLLNRLLHLNVLADKLPHPILTTLSQNTQGRYLLPILLALHLTFLLLIWIPLYLLSLLVTEVGIYLGILTVIIHGGRCLLRLLAFPGTNVKVYGEMEMEFARYSCKMLEGGVEAIVEFCGAIKQLKCRQQQQQQGMQMNLAPKLQKQLGLNEGGQSQEEWNSGDVASCYKRVVVYRDRVFGVYWQVFACLFEEDGKGMDPLGESLDGSSGNKRKKSNFYHRLEPTVSACKRNLCCDRNSTENNVNAGDGTAPEGIQLGSPDSGRLHDGENNSGDDSNFGGHDDRQLIIPGTNRFGNNPLMGDVGNMANLTHVARSDGKALYTLLGSLLDDLATLESSCAGILQNSEGKTKSSTTTTVLSNGVMEHVRVLEERANELNALVSRMKPPSSSGSGGEGGDDDENDDNNAVEDEVGVDAVRHRLEEHGTSSTASSSSNALGVVKSAMVAFLSMIDPPPHNYIFGLDVIRGCFLSRYRGARQFWVDRIGGSGKIDVIMIPSLLSSRNGRKKDSNSVARESILPLSPRQGRRAESGIDSSFNKNCSEGGACVPAGRKAVLYCNPNAGLAEVATGLGLIGGNVERGENERSVKETTCWAEFYIEHGFDVYLFNYAGYGRSYGGTSWNNKMKEKFVHGWFGSLRRVLFSTFLAFKPSSESLKSDATAVARHLVENVGIDELVIHGESIGGMAAAGASRVLTEKSNNNSGVSLLICDRTFCNLEAVAQRLIGGWTGNAIRLLTPSWSTDVANDFLLARCAKVVANDAADEIIHDYSSLKSGVSFSGELTKGDTNKVGWVMPAPLEYRVIDFENVSLLDSKVIPPALCKVNPPTWPVDKHISWKEAFHFAACAKRLGKMGTAAKKRVNTAVDDLELSEEYGEGIEVLHDSSIESAKIPNDFNNATNFLANLPSKDLLLVNIWSCLSCCDGLCGHPLGHTVKEGFDCTVSWLCCLLVFGGQVVADMAEMRWNNQPTVSSVELISISSEDFDLRPKGYQRDESDDLSKHPIPIPEVLSTLKEIHTQKNLVKEVEVELSYVIGMLEYVVQRLSSKENTAASLKRKRGYEDDSCSNSTGCFLNLNCGHNNQYSSDEHEKLMTLVRCYISHSV